MRLETEVIFYDPYDFQVQINVEVGLNTNNHTNQIGGLLLKYLL